MSFADTSDDRSFAQINITPLVDVMLVLLVIFMIAAPVMSKAIPYTIPQTSLPDTRTALPPEPITLRIDVSGGLSIDGQPVALTALADALSAQAGTDKGRRTPLWIDADADSQYEVAARVLAAANAAGLTQVGFVRH